MNKAKTYEIKPFYKHWRKRIFSVENTEKHNVISFLGIQLKIKRKINISKELKQLKKYKKEGYDTLYVPVSGIGDGLVFTSVAKALYNRDGKKVLISHKNNELFKNNPYIETIDGLYDIRINKNIAKKINKIGIDIVYPTYWNFIQRGKHYFLAYPKQHIIAETASKTGYIGDVELKPEVFLTDEEKKFGRFTNDKKQIVIMSTAIDFHKQWNKWQELVDSLKDKYYFVQLGAKNDTKLIGADDKRGIYTLRECASILYNSDLFVGQIGGLMHLARAVNCPSVVAYTSAEPEYLVKYISNENVKPQDCCNICTQDGTSAYSTKCIYGYKCTNTITLESIKNAIETKLNSPREFSFETVHIDNSKNVHMEEHYKRYSSNLVIIS